MPSINNHNDKIRIAMEKSTCFTYSSDNNSQLKINLKNGLKIIEIKLARFENKKSFNYRRLKSLGLNWAHSNKKYNIYLAYNKTKIKVKNTKSIYLNFNDIIKTKKLILDINPDYIINLAAITDVELCESNKN